MVQQVRECDHRNKWTTGMRPGGYAGTFRRALQRTLRGVSVLVDAIRWFPLVDLLHHRLISAYPFGTTAKLSLPLPKKRERRAGKNPTRLYIEVNVLRDELDRHCRRRRAPLARPCRAIRTSPRPERFAGREPADDYPRGSGEDFIRPRSHRRGRCLDGIVHRVFHSIKPQH